MWSLTPKEVIYTDGNARRIRWSKQELQTRSEERTIRTTL